MRPTALCWFLIGFVACSFVLGAADTARANICCGECLGHAWECFGFACCGGPRGCAAVCSSGWCDASCWSDCTDCIDQYC
jgi:hypothetical protein